MNTPIAVIAFVGIVLASQPSFCQSVALSDRDAADRAAAIVVAVQDTWIVGADSIDATPQRAMQHRIDRIGTLAEALEAEIRAGSDRATTQKLFREIRRVASSASELAVHQKVGIDSQRVALFDRLLADLERYYAQ